MSRLYIQGINGSPDITYYEITALSQLTVGNLTLIECDWSGTISDPKQAYKSAAGELLTYTFAGDHDVGITRYDASTGAVNIGSATHIAVVGYTYNDGTTKHNRVLWAPDDGTGTVALATFQGNSWGTDNVLYNVDGDSLPVFVLEETSPEETPSTDPDDPNNNESRGGENADTMPFDTTDLQTDLPSPSALDYDVSKLCTLYMLDTTQLGQLGTALFDNTIWSSLQNKFAGLSDPLSMMLNVYQLPIVAHSGSATFQLGGETFLSGGSPISCKYVTQRYEYFSMGSINLKEVWGSAKDYNDTSVSIFLPFCGVKELDPDIVVGTTISLHCYVDVWTGDITYILKSLGLQSSKYFRTESAPYRWTGNCAKKLPIGRIDTTGAIANLASSGISLVGGLALSAATANPAGAIAGLAGAASLLGTGLRPTVQSSGNVSGTPGYMDYMYAYLMIKRGVPQFPNNWKEQFGAPRYQTFLINDLSGYTEFDMLHAEIADATAEEKQAIESQMRQGVIL